MTRRFLNGETQLSNPQLLHTEYIGMQREPGELKHLSTRRKRKKIFDFLSSGERKGMSLNRSSNASGLRTAISESYGSGTVLGKPAIKSESLVHETRRQRAGSKVPRDTRNLAGIRGDHPPRLNTT